MFRAPSLQKFQSHVCTGVYVRPLFWESLRGLPQQMKYIYIYMYTYIYTYLYRIGSNFAD